MKTGILLFALLICTLSSLKTFSQKPAYFGFGMGFEYGGLGIKAEALLTNHISLFGGCGYNFNGIGYNVGGTVKLGYEKTEVPYFTAMYGYNAVIKVSGYGIEEAKTYYGPTVGFGIDLFGKALKNKLSMALLVPFRSSSFHDDYDALKEMGVKFSNGYMPIGFSMGYNIRLNRK